MRPSKLLLIAFVACGQPDGQPSAITEPVASQSAPLKWNAGTAAHGAMVWVDATGATVPYLLQFGFGGSAFTDEEGGMFLDANGIMWSFGLYTCGAAEAICPPYAAYNNYPYPTYFDGTNCMGNAYVPYVHANMAFTLQGQSGNTIRALTPSANVAMQFLQSWYGGNGTTTCNTGTIVHILAAPLTDAPVVTPPATLPFTLPVHPVMLN